jgi:hypothetical protein
MSTPDRDIRRRSPEDPAEESRERLTDEQTDEITELPDRDAMSILAPGMGSDWFAPYPGMPVDSDE